MSFDSTHAMAKQAPPRALAALRLILAIAVFPAVFVLFALGVSPAAAAPAEMNASVAYAFKMAGDENRARVIVHFEKEPEIHWFMLTRPDRLVLDLPRTKFGFDPKSLEPRGMVTGVRYGLVSDSSSRLIIAMDGPFKVENLRFAGNENMPGTRLIIDLVSVSEKEFSSLLADQAAITSSTVAAKADRLGLPRHKERRKFVIVIDPGHGGIDSGATGKDHSIEKKITLKFSKELKKSLEESDKYKVFLTRDDDRYLRLDERAKIARDHHADLFISVHADTVSQNWVRGATVYTLSEKASDALAGAVAERENLSDTLAGGALPDDKKEVTDILLDLVQRETKAFSNRFATELVGAMSATVGMINNSHRSAGFRVLRSYDVPSVLLELGYLSNMHDADNMMDDGWREKAVGAIVSAIDRYRALKSANGGD